MSKALDFLTKTSPNLAGIIEQAIKEQTDVQTAEIEALKLENATLQTVQGELLLEVAMLKAGGNV